MATIIAYVNKALTPEQVKDIEKIIVRELNHDDKCKVIKFDGHVPEDFSCTVVNTIDDNALGKAASDYARNKGFEKFLKNLYYEKKDKEKSMKTTSLITVGIIVAGAHRYPESTRVYLRDFHRHDFKISVNIGVVDQNRQYEFYDVQEGLVAALDSLFVKMDKTTYNFGNRSCEHIANELFPVLSKKYPVVHSVAVFEDDFNGATVVLDGNPKDHYKMSFRHGGIVPGVNDAKKM